MTHPVSLPHSPFAFPCIRRTHHASLYLSETPVPFFDFLTRAHASITFSHQPAHSTFLCTHHGTHLATLSLYKYPPTSHSLGLSVISSFLLFSALRGPGEKRTPASLSSSPPSPPLLLLPLSLPSASACRRSQSPAYPPQAQQRPSNAPIQRASSPFTSPLRRLYHTRTVVRYTQSHLSLSLTRHVRVQGPTWCNRRCPLCLLLHNPTAAATTPTSRAPWSSSLPFLSPLDASTSSRARTGLSLSLISPRRRFSLSNRIPLLQLHF